ncbi:MAG: 50S ribosomal protein L5, partial [Patescibacteria group bacterium]
KAVDARGNLSIGFRESTAFPEVRSDELENTHGLEVTISTNAHSRDEGAALFTLLGFPFKK